jgi:hypothetical protein
MSTARIIGVVSCTLIMVSLFLNWAWYPDIEKYFTAFFSEKNYYGKPGKVLLFFAITGIIFYFLNKVWTQRLNLLFGALCMAFAIRTYLLYTSGYDGYVPEAQPGIYLMLLGCLGHLITSMTAMAVVKNPNADTSKMQESKA